MSAINGFETSLLSHIFKNTAISNVGDGAGLPASATPDCLYVSIYETDPTETGAAGTEATYTDYARVGMCRSAAGWTVATNCAENAAAVVFPVAGGGSTCTCYFGIHTAISAGDFLLYGTVTTPIAVSVGITPEFAAGALCVTID